MKSVYFSLLVTLFFMPTNFAKSGPAEGMHESFLSSELIDKLLAVNERADSIDGRMADYLAGLSKRVEANTALKLRLVIDAKLLADANKALLAPAKEIMKDVVEKNEFTKDSEINLFWAIKAVARALGSGEIYVAEGFVVIHWCDVEK